MPQLNTWMRGEQILLMMIIIQARANHTSRIHDIKAFLIHSNVMCSIVFACLHRYTSVLTWSSVTQAVQEHSLKLPNYPLHLPRIALAFCHLVITFWHCQVYCLFFICYQFTQAMLFYCLFTRTYCKFGIAYS